MFIKYMYNKTRAIKQERNIFTSFLSLYWSYLVNKNINKRAKLLNLSDLTDKNLTENLNTENCRSIRIKIEIEVMIRSA